MIGFRKVRLHACFSNDGVRNVSWLSCRKHCEKPQMIDSKANCGASISTLQILLNAALVYVEADCSASGNGVSRCNNVPVPTGPYQLPMHGVFNACMRMSVPRNQPRQWGALESFTDYSKHVYLERLEFLHKPLSKLTWSYCRAFLPLPYPRRRKDLQIRSLHVCATVCAPCRWLCPAYSFFSQPLSLTCLMRATTFLEVLTCFTSGVDVGQNDWGSRTHAQVQQRFENGTGCNRHSNYPI